MHSLNLIVVLGSLVYTAGAAAVTTLHDETWLENVAGKSIFVFFDEPGNPACRELDQIWAQLSKEWEGHPVGLVARVDCADHRSQILCEEYAFTTLPILMYGDPDSPEFYEKEDRSFKALSAFAKEHISKPPCNVLNLHNCDQKERQLLEDLMKKPREDLEEMERKAEERIGELEKKLDAKIQEIQAQYTKLVSEFNEQIDKVRKETNYKWLQQVLHEMDIRMAEEGVEF